MRQHQRCDKDRYSNGRLSLMRKFSVYFYRSSLYLSGVYLVVYTDGRRRERDAAWPASAADFRCCDQNILRYVYCAAEVTVTTIRQWLMTLCMQWAMQVLYASRANGHARNAYHIRTVQTFYLQSSEPPYKLKSGQYNKLKSVCAFAVAAVGAEMTKTV